MVSVGKWWMTNDDLVDVHPGVTQPTRPGDAHRGKDVSWDELSHLWTTRQEPGTTRTIPKVGQPANRRQDPIGGNENHEDPVSRLLSRRTGKVSRGNVKTAKSCHNGNDLGGSWNPHEMSLRCDCGRIKWTGWQLLCMRWSNGSVQLLYK